MNASMKYLIIITITSPSLFGDHDVDLRCLIVSFINCPMCGYHWSWVYWWVYHDDFVFVRSRFIIGLIYNPIIIIWKFLIQTILIFRRQAWYVGLVWVGLLDVHWVYIYMYTNISLIKLPKPDIPWEIDDQCPLSE